MKPILKWTTSILLVVLLFNACKKEYSCEVCLTFGEPPIADAGVDQIITLPKDSALLDGSASADPDGSIAEYKWSKVAGPPSYSIANLSSAQTMTTSLEQGVYQFELIVTDDDGFLDKDTMQVTVLSSTNQPPIANAGADQTLVLPVNSIELDGSASSDPDNNISSYSWTNISGPGSNTIVSNSSIKTEVNELIAGTYLFELRVTDAEGLFSLDTMQVIVSATVGNSNCDISDRPIVNARMTAVHELTNRIGTSVTTAGNKLLIAGGFNAGLLDTRVDIWDISSNTWTTAELSEARYNMATAVLGNKIFFAGGFSEGGQMTSSDNIDIYDVVTNTWTTAQLSEAGGDKVGAAAGNKVLFAGGVNENGEGGNRVDIYDALTDSWTSELLPGRGSGYGETGMTATVVGDNIYLAGGYDNGNRSSLINIYNTISGSWTSSNLSLARGGMGGISVGDYNYWVGGISGSAYGWESYSDLVEIRAMPTSTSTFHCLFQPAIRPGMVEHDGRIIIFRPTYYYGSDPPAWIVQDRFDIYDISTNSWFIGQLPRNIIGADIIRFNNSVYVIYEAYSGANTKTVYKLELDF